MRQIWAAGFTCKRGRRALLNVEDLMWQCPARVIAPSEEPDP